MAPKKHLSTVEWEVMKCIWEKERPVSVRDVLDTLYPNGEKAYTTIQTIMNNLVKKGFLKREKIGLVNFYRTREQKQSILAREIEAFVEKVFGGSRTALAQFLLDTDQLTPEEIDHLQKLLEKKQR